MIDRASDVRRIADLFCRFPVVGGLGARLDMRLALLIGQLAGCISQHSVAWFDLWQHHAIRSDADGWAVSSPRRRPRIVHVGNSTRRSGLRGDHSHRFG